MPGNTLNTNLLDGLNNLILTVNELVAATENQSLNPTINAPVTVEPPINNFSPTFSPTNTVNFDTASIVSELAQIVAKPTITDTAIVPELQSLNASLASVSTNTAHLSELAQIALNSDYLSELQRLAVLEFIQTCICDIAEKYTNEVPAAIIGPVTTALVDAAKCTASKTIAGYWNYRISEIVQAFEQADWATGTAAFIASGLPGGQLAAFYIQGLNQFVKHLTVFGVDQDLGDTTYQLRPKADYDDFKNNWQSISDTVIQTLYDNTVSSTASTALLALADAQTFPQWQIDLLKEVYFNDTEKIELGYLGQLNEKHGYGQDFSTFSTYECIGTDPDWIEGWDCDGDSSTPFGTPDAFVSSNFGDSGTYTSELRLDEHTIWINFKYLVNVTINSWTLVNGLKVVRYANCSNFGQSENIVPADQPYTVENVSRVVISSAEAQFTANLTISRALPVL